MKVALPDRSFRCGARTALWLGLLGCLNACGEPQAPLPPVAPTITEIKVSIPTNELLVGDTIRATAEAYAGPARLDAVTFEWSTTHPDVIEVDARGRVRAKAFGMAAVRATARGVTGGVTMLVRAVTRVEITPTAKELLVGDTARFAATVFAGSITIRPVLRWTSSNPAVAVIDSTGLLRAVAPGATEVTVTALNGTQSVHVVVITPLFDKPAAEKSSIAAGGDNTCALTPRSEAYCWGWNGGIVLYGIAYPPSLLAVGDTVSDVVTPTKVVGGLSFTSVVNTTSTERMNLRCGLTSEGAPYCWGAIGWFEAQTPTAIPGGIRFTTVSAGAAHFCGVEMNGQVFCWGDNRAGQLGQTPSDPITSPRQVALPEPMIAVGAGGFHSCALSTTGRVYCWGKTGPWIGNNADPSDVYRSPVAVESTTPFVRLYVRGHWFVGRSCALTRAGELFCWGDKYFGDRIKTPESLGFNQRFASVALGDSHTCGIESNGTAWCWGVSDLGKLGNGDTGVLRTSPMPVNGGKRFVQLSGGQNHTCGIATNGELFCWGSRLFGQLGDGYSEMRRFPVPVASNETFVAIAGDAISQCALNQSGQAFCWGSNPTGQLGVGDRRPRWMPTPVLTSARFRSIDLGPAKTCALDFDGVAYCWGSNGPTTPGQVSASLHFAAISAGSAHACALTSDGKAYCWGSNRTGQLGAGDFTDSATPRPVAGDFRFTQIKAGGDYTCAVTTAGHVYCWGLNVLGTMGRAEVDAKCSGVSGVVGLPCTRSPKFVPLLPAVSHIGMTDTNVCAITVSGELYCWGSLGSAPAASEYCPNNTLLISFWPCIITPVPVSGLQAKLIGGRFMTPRDDPVYGFGVLDRSGTVFKLSAAAPGIFVARRQDLRMTFTAFANQCGLVTGGKVYCWGLWYTAGDGIESSSTVPIRSGTVLFTTAK